MAMMKEIMGCFTRSKRGEEKGDGDGESAQHDFKQVQKHAGKNAGSKTFPQHT